MNGIPWTADRIEQLTAMWTDWLSCSTIARAIGGVSRNAVIGKVTRLGLPPRAQRHGGARTPRVPYDRRASGIGISLRPYIAPVPQDEPDTLGPERDFGAAGTCRWIHGDPGVTEWRVCGQPAVTSYCAYHQARSVTRSQPAPVENRAVADASQTRVMMRVGLA